MLDASSIAYFLVGSATVLSLLKFFNTRGPNLDHIPTYGPSGPIFSYFGVIPFLRNATNVIREGCQKYPGAVFKVATLDKYQVVVSGPRLIDDVRKAPTEVLSLRSALAEFFQGWYTLGYKDNDNLYHFSVIRTFLTKNIEERFSEIHDEIVTACDETLALKGNEWSKVLAKDAILHIVCRVSNRYFIGLPLCRDPDYVDFSCNFTVGVITVAQTINMFPVFLRPFVGPLLSNYEANRKSAMKHLRPMIEERIQKMAEQGKDWADRPNDLISWLLESAEDHQKTVDDVVLRILAVNFASIHTTSTTFTHMLYHLASKPEYVEPMRKEVESVVRKEGWTKSAMAQLSLVDSFIRESQRVDSFSCLSMDRKTARSFTFSDGTVLPPNTLVSVASTMTHKDEENYPRADEFDGFRFAKLREEAGEESKHQLVSLELGFIGFGNGKNACPGRFFAANEMKALLAHILVTYDVKFENEGVRPANECFATYILPNSKAKVMFRKRQT